MCTKNPGAHENFKATPMTVEALMGRKSPSRSPPQLAGLPSTHCQAVLVSAPLAQLFPHRSFSLPLAFAFPFSARTFHLHEGNELCSLRHEKRFPSTSQLAFHDALVSFVFSSFIAEQNIISTLLLSFSSQKSVHRRRPLRTQTAAAATD